MNITHDNITHTLAENATFGEVLIFILTGLVVVLITLILLSVVSSIIGYLFREKEKIKRLRKIFAADWWNKTKTNYISPKYSSTDEDEKRLVAVLAAAANEALGKPIRIVSYLKK